MYLLLKALLSGAIVALASELARRSTTLAAVLISLPLTVADLSWSILWVIVPSLVFFVVLPVALRSLSFWPALLFACRATAASYGAWIWAARRLGFDL